MPLIAIVGRPNVGKSTLFNRLVGGRPALVHGTPGLTRDRRYGECDYFGAVMRVVDTGGLDPEAARDVIGAGIHRQALRAIGEADALVLVVDGRAGLSAVDHALASQLRATGKPVFLVVNKIDHPVRDDLVHEFHVLGLGTPYPISASHGRGIDPMLEAIAAKVGARRPDEPAGEGAGGDQDRWDILEGDLGDESIDPAEELEGGDARRARREDADAEPLRVAFVGRPNAGKSSLTNRLLGEERSLVHHVAGTTTDPVDTAFSIGGRDYVLVDTAGIRRKAKIDADVEKLAVTMALSQIERADIVVLVIDAQLGPAEQDARIAGMVEEAGRGLVIALNKSDLV
ncbi:MAG: ribosome biogenesis GTPase Der, partial [Solirubrobacteraceae bacterium]